MVSKAADIERVRAQWRLERPDLDTSPMTTIGRLLQLHVLLEGRLSRCLAQHGLDLGGFDVLATLRRGGAPYRSTPTALYRELVLSSGGITVRMDKLQRAGLVLRSPSTEDRRSLSVELTENGRELVDTVIASYLQEEASMEDHLSTTERKQLAALLKKLITGLEQDHVEE